MTDAVMSSALTSPVSGANVGDMTQAREARGRVPYAEAARALLRDTLLDATQDMLRDRAWASVTMADVASVAGVSRQTLYNEFGSRQGLAQAYILRDVDIFLNAVEQAVVAHPDDPRDAVAAAFDVFFSAAAQDPLVKTIVAGDDGSDGLLALVTTHGGPVLERATERLAEIIVSTWPRLALPPARLVAECVVRLAISHVALPTGPAHLTAQSVGDMLGPYLDQLLQQSV